jgi:hypothetical protein
MVSSLVDPRSNRGISGGSSPIAVHGDQAVSGLDSSLVGDTAFEDIEEDPHGLCVIGF